MASIHHLAIESNDIPASISWYQENIGCEIAYQDKTWALLAFDNIKIALVTPGQHPPHIGIAIEGADRYGPLKLHRDKSLSVYVKDPSGNSVEFLEKSSLTGKIA